MENNKPTAQIIQHDMLPESRTRLIALATLGLQWVAGKINLEDVEARYGKPELIGPLNDDEKTYLFDMRDYGAVFKWNLKNEKAKHADSRTFRINLEFNVRVNIDRDELKDALGLNRTKIGELIDGVRVEQVRYFGAIPGLGDPNTVHLNYLLPLPDTSEFDVRARFDYKQLPEQAGSTLETTQNIRYLEVYRSYLTPQELQQRNDAKRQKFGYMGLCTGMTCPEAGYWEAWGANGPLDVELMKAGDRYPTARSSLQTVKAGGPYAVDARYFWLCSTEQEDLAGARMVPLRRAQNG
ncbi:hypothetical protein [Caballeronia insecticola]|uniref:Uncharacterized protein n=1 Tax=Caballeronia insecticola TaxID=758793 RepID=R4WZ20_9BURK|nr:hypothetical protein [Caballeronia insecticola]BAN26860.1 putative uncharacterized protein [Caballeronia insecticola]